MSIERRPISALNSQKASMNSSLNLYGEIKTRVSSLLTTARSLSDTTSSSVFNARAGSSSDETKITATANTSASTGTFLVRVKQLATGATVQSTGELTSKSAATSSSKVAPGSGTIDVSKSFANAGFGSTPDGTVTINGQVFTLSDYSTVQTFMDAVNSDVTANANMYYDKTADKFTIEQKSTATDLVISETGTNPFFAQAKITAGTFSGNGSTGIQSGVLLSKANFDTALTSTTSGSLKINGVSLSYNTSTDTLDNVLSRINSSTANVNAFYDSSLDKVIVKSKNTGSTDTVTLADVTGNLLSTLKLSGATPTSGTDALFTINSTASGDQISKSTNSFAINGINYNLKNTNVSSYTDNTYTTVTVKQDTSAVQAKISDFFNQFNSITSYIKDKSSVDITTKTRGPLAGNSTFTSLRTQLFQKFTEQVTGLTGGDPDYLSKIGITLGSGSIAILSDSSKFTDAMASNSKAVENLFNSTNGIAKKVESLLKPYVESSSATRGSIIDETKSVLSSRVTSLDGRIKRMEERMALKERQYSQQLYKMQDLLNRFVLQGNQIASMTNSLASYYG
ncbi:MAG: flagellar filament capping protein FliD [Planctomycetota bacterium]